MPGIKVSFDSSATDTKAISHNNDKVDLSMVAADSRLSVLDLLRDDGHTSNSMESLLYEDHVAFSVEGLGTVKMETPVHSPQHGSYRDFSCGGPSPYKPLRRAHSSKKLSCGMDGLEHKMERALLDDFPDVDKPFDASSWELPPYARDVMEPFRIPKQKAKYREELPRLDGNLKYFGNNDISYHDNGYCNFNEYSFVDEECSLPQMNWPCCFESCTTKHFDVSNFEKEDLSFEGLHMQKKRGSVKSARRHNLSELPAPFTQQQISEHDHDFSNSYRRWYPKVGRNFDFDNLNNQATWSFFLAGDGRESLSRLSEESCSSSAVTREEKRDPLFDPTPRQGKRDCVNLLKRREYQGQLESLHKPGKSIKSSNLHSFTAFQEKLLPEDFWLFKDGNLTWNVKENLSPRTSQARNDDDSCFNLWNEEPLGSYEPNSECKIYSERSKFDGTEDFFSEKLSFSHPLSPLCTSKSPVFFHTDSGSNEPSSSLSPELKKQHSPRESFSVPGERKERDFTNGGRNERISKDKENKSNVCSSPSNELPRDVVDSEDNCVDCNESSYINSKSTPGENANLSPGCLEEESSSVEIPNVHEDGFDGKERWHGMKSLPPNRSGLKESEDLGSQEKSVLGKVLNTHGDGSCQVMMLESCVLQLLCVQVMKEASALGTGKKLQRREGSQS